MVQDLLDHLGWYRGLSEKMDLLIDFLDRGEVYEMTAGSYEHEHLRYQIIEYVTDESAVSELTSEATLQIILEGEEIFSIKDGDRASVVSIATVGMFIYLRGGMRFSHRQHHSGEQRVKKVIFFL